MDEKINFELREKYGNSCGLGPDTAMGDAVEKQLKK